MAEPGPSTSQPAPFIQVGLDWKKLLPKKRTDVERDMADLPYSEPELVRQCQLQYEEAAQHGGQDALDACFRLSWALVHSRVAAEVQRGIELAEALTDTDSLQQRDLLYLIAVGRFRQRKYLEARRTLKGLVQVHPEFRQAVTLLDACDREVMKDGLVGVGAGAAIIGAIAAVAIAAARR